MNNIMIDLEMMGLDSNSAIVSIGAVFFDKSKGLGEQFYSTITLKSNTEQGRTVDLDTLLWWMAQSDEARNEIISATHELYPTLLAFESWFYETYPDSDAPIVWSKGSLDTIILENAFRNNNIKCPWDYHNVADFRTYSGMVKAKTKVEIKIPKQGVCHNALDDAKNQAVELITIMSLEEMGRNR